MGLFSEMMETQAEQWRHDMQSAPTDRFILLYCAEDKSRWFAKWTGDSWFGVDEHGLRREGHSAGDPNFVTGWFVNAWVHIPAPPTDPSTDGVSENRK